MTLVSFVSFSFLIFLLRIILIRYRITAKAESPATPPLHASGDSQADLPNPMSLSLSALIKDIISWSLGSVSCSRLLRIANAADKEMIPSPVSPTTFKALLPPFFRPPFFIGGFRAFEITRTSRTITTVEQYLIAVTVAVLRGGLAQPRLT